MRKLPAYRRWSLHRMCKLAVWHALQRPKRVVGMVGNATRASCARNVGGRDQVDISMRSQGAALPCGEKSYYLHGYGAYKVLGLAESQAAFLFVLS